MGRKKIKKLIITILLVATFVGLSAMSALATQLKFKDLAASKYDWVRPYIEKMALAEIIKGMTDSTYAPDASVTRAQTVTMLVRIMGWENQAKGKKLPSSFPKPNTVPTWASEYVALAVEKGIISDRDLENFRADDATKRSELAVFAVKALGLGDEAKNRKNVNIAIKFADGYDIELDARAFVEIAIEKEIMKGYPDNTFKPNEKITRAEMAKVLNNIAKNTNAYNIVSGEVQDVDTILLPSITIKLPSGSLTTYTVKDTTSVYLEDEKGALEKAQLKDIKSGKWVHIIADPKSKNAALYIDVMAKTSQTPIDSNQDTKDKDKGKDQDKNQDKNQDQAKQIKGILRYFNSSTNTIAVESDKYENYTLSPRVRIYKNDKTADLLDLHMGDWVILTLSDGKVEKVDAESSMKEAEGVIKAISFATRNPLITVEDSRGQKRDYELDKNVTIRKNDRSADIKDLRIGDEVTLDLEYNTATRVEVRSDKKDISGVVKTIVFADTTTITIVDDKGREHTVTITRDTDIYQDRRKIEATELRRDYHLDIEVENGEAISIDVTTREIQNTIKGIVQNVNDKVKVIAIKVKNDDGTKEEKHIYYTSDTSITRNNREISARRIYEGDEIVAVGKYDGGLFFADTIIDLTLTE